MKFGIVVFPGSNCDRDCLHVTKNVMGQSARIIWHQETTLGEVDCVVLPGGFSYGDYLRTGAIARFSPVMAAVQQYAADGGLVIGICNGFQVLCEAHLLPGGLIQNRDLRFLCKDVRVRVERNDSPFTRACETGRTLQMPIAHHGGSYFADDATLQALEANGQVLLRYSDAAGNVNDATNPNGSLGGIAGICNPRGNVFGVMPHPERASEGILGCDDGRAIFESIVASVSAN
jgi:phosphoribosylformylglycinamidine synthase